MADPEKVRLKKALQIAADVIEANLTETRSVGCSCQYGVGQAPLCPVCDERYKTVGIMRAMGVLDADETRLWELLSAGGEVSWEQAQTELVRLLRVTDGLIGGV